MRTAVAVAAVGRLNAERGAGIPCQIDGEAAIGLMRQIRAFDGGEPDTAG